jgi:4-diphosphocytidyl-2C-methyl-D-erythritol kinase
LCPEISVALAEARETGAEEVFVSGSGPTVVGLFAGSVRSADDGLRRAERAAVSLRGRVPAPVCARPVDAAFGRVMTVASPNPA